MCGMCKLEFRTEHVFIIYFFILLPNFTSIIAAGTSSKYSKQPDPGWCGFINPRQANGVILLYEKEIVDRNELIKIQFNGAVKNSAFRSQENCTLEICGFSSTGQEPYDKGTCEWYMGDELIQASPDIYDRNYEVTSIGCACRTVDDANYYCSSGSETEDHCASINDKHIWNDLECAIMFQERNCESCYFKPISLLYGRNFRSLNSFQMKSMVVRPGCIVDKHTNGKLWIDKESTLKLEGIVYNTDPAYHEDSENFTCNCSPEVISTTPEPSTVEPTKEDENHGVMPALQYVVVGVGLVIVIVVVIGLTLIQRQRNHRKFSSNTTITNLESEQDDLETNRQCDYNVQTFSINSFEPDELQEFPELSTDFSLPFQTDHQFLSLNDEVLTSSNRSDYGSDKTENQLKAEIMDEVKKLMETFHVGSAVNDDMHFLNNSQSRQNTTTSEAGPPNFNLLIEQFNQVCDPSNIIPREAFMVPETELRNPFGVGQYGIVYKAVLREESDGFLEKVALKKIKWTGSQSFFREIRFFQSIRNGNEHIVKFLGACCHTDGLFLLTEFCEGGSLRDHVLEKMRPQVFKQSGPLPEISVNLGDDYYGINNDLEQRWLEEIQPVLNSSDLHQLLYWSEQIANGMEFLSANRTIHDDLALRNILLTKDLKVKICDFGLSRKCLNTEDCARSLMTGDFPFNSFAPEFVNEAVNEPKQMSLYVDVWAYGCTLYELFTLGDSLYEDVKEPGLLKFITVRKLLMEGYRHPKPLLAPDSVYHKMMSCWNEVPKNRPSFTELRSFFEVEKSKVSNYTDIEC